MKVPANLVSSSLNMYYKGTSIKAIARNLEHEYGTMPSTATIYKWIKKYTQYAIDSVKNYKPKDTGDIFITDEAMIEKGGKSIWLWDIIDDKTGFILATHISGSRISEDAEILYKKAVKIAGKEPKLVKSDKLAPYLNVRYSKKGKGQQIGIARSDDNAQKTGHSCEALKQRTKILQGLKNIESARDFLDGWLVYHNYLKPHITLFGKTPAEVAGVNYPYKSWVDIIYKHKPSKIK